MIAWLWVVAPVVLIINGLIQTVRGGDDGERADLNHPPGGRVVSIDVAKKRRRA